MQCSVENCPKPAAYKKAQLCQAHYFRLRRTGTVEERIIARKRHIETPNGYIRTYEPDHPLACERGYVFEHRRVMWGQVGETVGACRICGRDEAWATCHVDHINNDRKDNRPENLRVLCRGCNIKRGLTQECYATRGEVGLLEFEGRIGTPADWARDPRVSVTAATIVRRKKSGMTDRDALFAEKVTHKGAAA